MMDKVLVVGAGVLCACACFMSCRADEAANAVGLHPLPEDCIPIAYIQGVSEPGTCLYMTNYVPNPQTDRLECVFELTSVSAPQTLWCSRERNGGWEVDVRSWTAFVLAGGSVRCDYNRERGAFSCNTPLAVGVKYTLEVSNNVCRVSNGAGVDYALDATLTQGGGPFALFAVYANKDLVEDEDGFSSFGTHRLYSFKVWRNGTLLHDCVPYRQNGDANVGLYDRVAGQELSKYRSRTFIAGPDCATNLAVAVSAETLFVGPDAVPPSPVVTDSATGRVLVPGMDYTVEDVQTAAADVRCATVKSRTGSGAAGEKRTWYSTLAVPPPGYTRLEYIEGDGAAMLMTDYVPNPQTDVLSIDYAFTRLETTAFLCAREYAGAASNAGRSWSFCAFPTASPMPPHGFYRFDYNRGVFTTGSVGEFAVGARCTATLSNNVAIVSCGGQLAPEIQTDFTAAGGSLMFYAFYVSETLQNVNSISHHRMYGCTVRRAGELLHDWIPVRRESDGLVTLLDRVSGEALTPIFKPGETGAFIAGPACGKQGVRVADVPVQVWDGTAPCTPALDVRAVVDGRSLVLGEDYSVVYSDNAAAGNATATVTGVGDWAGLRVVVPFVVERALPAGYTRLDYIQGDGRSYFLTDWTVRPWEDRMETEIEFTQTNVDAALWCSRGTTTQDRSVTVFQLASGLFRNDYANKAPKFAQGNGVHVDTRYHVVCANGHLRLGDVAESTNWPITWFTEAGGPLMFCASYVNGTGNNLNYYSTHRIFGFSIWRNGRRERAWVPVKNADGVATLYDVMQGDELTPMGAGAFIAGPVRAAFDLSVRNQPWDGVKKVKPSVVATNRVTSAELVRGVEYRTTVFTDAEAGQGRVVATGFASYAGQRATADFKVYAALPDGYERLEYVQGDGKSALPTTFLPNPQTDKIQVDWAVDDASMAGVFCARVDSKNMSWSFCLIPAPLWGRFDYGSLQHGLNRGGLAFGCGERHRLVVENCHVTLDNGWTLEGSGDASFTEAGGPLMIGGYYRGTPDNVTHYARLRVYDFRVWRSGTLLHHWVPVRTADGVATLYDVVTQTALTPTCLPGGAFLAGPAWPTDPVPPAGTILILR